jgi:hypothetical protein
MPANTTSATGVPYWAALGVGLAAFAAYALAATPTAYPLDSAELAAAAFGLGVAHPPGEETTLLWAKLFTLLPLGSIAFKVALAQAAAGAAAAMLVFLLVFELSSPLAPARGNLRPATRALLAGPAALAFAYAPGVVIVSNRAEVYAVGTALALGALWLALRARAEHDGRPAALAGLLVGLGVGNHSLVAGLAGVGAVAAALPAWLAASRRARFATLAVAAFAAGMLIHAYLPLRGAALLGSSRDMDQVAWGDPRSLPGLWWLVSAKTFVDKAALVHGYSTPMDLPFMLIEELGLGCTLLAPAGAYLLLRRSAARMPAVAVLLTAAGSLGAALVGGVDPGNPDIRGYLGPAIAGTAVLCGVALTIGLAHFRRERARAVLAVILLAAAVARCPGPTRYPGLARARAATSAARDLLEDLPPRAALFTSHFETGFLVGYLRLVEGARPDVAWVHLGFVHGMGYDARIRTSTPDLAPTVAGYGTGRFLAALEELDATRPVRIEPDAVLDEETRRNFGPAGSLWSLAKHASLAPVPELPGWALAEATNDPQVRAFLAWRNYIDARWSCDLGFSARARARFAQLELLVPRDERFRQLAQTCPLYGHTPP